MDLLSGRRRRQALAALSAAGSVASILAVAGVPLAAALDAGLGVPVAVVVALAVAGLAAWSLRRAARATIQARDNRRVEPLLRAALVGIVESRRAIDALGPARGAPATARARAWSPALGPLDRFLRRTGLAAEPLAYLLWLAAEAREATTRLHDRIDRNESWFDEWLVVRERLSVLGCLLLAEADARRMTGVAQSFSGNPWLAAPAGYGPRAMTAANDRALRGAPAFPTASAYAACRPVSRDEATQPSAKAPQAPVSPESRPRLTEVALRAVTAALSAMAFPVGTLFAFWILAVAGVHAVVYPWMSWAAIAAGLFWVLVYASTAVVTGGSPTWIAMDQLFQAVSHLDVRALMASPVLNAVAIWPAALAFGQLAALSGAAREPVVGLTFLVVNVVVALRLVASALD